MDGARLLWEVFPSYFIWNRHFWETKKVYLGAFWGFVIACAASGDLVWHFKGKPHGQW